MHDKHCTRPPPPGRLLCARAVGRRRLRLVGVGVTLDLRVRLAPTTRGRARPVGGVQRAARTRRSQLGGLGCTWVIVECQSLSCAMVVQSGSGVCTIRTVRLAMASWLTVGRAQTPA